MRASNCALIILASGLSERFGPENKLLVNLNGKPMIGHVIETVTPLSFAQKIAVISDDDVRAPFEAAGFHCVVNPEPARGHARSRSLGIKAALDLGCEAALIMLGDMPFITRSHIESILDTARQHDVVFSLRGDVKMPPVLFKGEALKQIADSHRPKGTPDATVPLSPGCARDIDTKGDLAKASRLP